MDGGSPNPEFPTHSRAGREARQHLLGISLGLLRSRVLYAAAELGVADALADGPMTCAALAARLNTDHDGVYRLMRTLAAMGIFVELEGEAFALNEAAQPLRSDGALSVRDLVRYLGAEWNVRTLVQVLHSVRTGKPSFDVVHGVSLFNYLEHHEADGRLFDVALERFAIGTVSALLDAFDFSRFTKVVDVGGGKGQLLCALLRSYPAMTGILMDRPDVIESVRMAVGASDVGDRVELASGDFFEAVPPDGDAYVLKHIIHDWHNERATRILANCRRAMRTGSTVLLVDSVLAGRNEGEFAKLMDAGMLMTTGGRERTADEFADLLQGAGLRLVQVTPTRSPYCVVEAVAA